MGALMRSALLFLCLAFVACTFAQRAGFRDAVIIDEFTTVTRQIIITTEDNTVYPVTQTAFATATDGSIIGNERDLQLVVVSGQSNLLMTAGVANGNFQCATPDGAQGYSTVQWDGADASFNLQANGLGALNFRADSNFAFRARIFSDLSTIVSFRVYSGSGSALCSRNLTLPGGESTNEFELDFSRVGAIEMIVQQRPQPVDVTVELFTVLGPIPQTPSPTPSPSPIPSNSRTPTPTPSPSEQCICRCPVFTCEVFRVTGQYNYYTIALKDLFHFF